MTAPTPKDGLREALDHDDARADAAFKRKYSNLARCYLDLIAQRDAAEARALAAEGEVEKLKEWLHDEEFNAGWYRNERDDALTRLEAALSASRFSQKETGDGEG